MSKEIKNTVQIKSFLGMEEVRVVNNTHIVLKDMFNALGRVKEDGGWNHEKKKMEDFLKLIGKIDDHQKLGVDFGKTKGRGNKSNGSIQTVDCLKLETVPVVLTQFRPVNSNKRTKEENVMALKQWAEFMKFVDELLVQAKCFEFVVADTELEKQDTERISKLGGSPMVMNQQICLAMGEIVVGDAKFRLKKDQLKIYQNQTTIDLIECRRFMIDEFIRAYRITKSHKDAKKYAVEATMEYYGLTDGILAA